MKKLFASIALAIALTACATPQNPAETVLQARTAQNVALRAAVTYRELKPCATPPVQPCSDKTVVSQLQLADKVSDQALAAAESAVRAKTFTADVVDSAVAAAKAALAAFQSLVATFGGK